MRRQLGQRLGEGEVVGELRAGLLLALPDGRAHGAPRPDPLAQLADQVGVLGEGLDEDGARTVEGRRDVRDALVGVDVLLRDGLRVVRRVGEQQVRERLQPGLAGDHRLGPALGLEGQVDVLQAGLRLGGHDLRRQGGVQLALAADRLQDGDPALLELAQVAQPLLQRPELGVVEAARDLLAVPGDERHGGPAVEQLDRGLDLPGLDVQLGGDPVRHRRQDGRGQCVVGRDDRRDVGRGLGRARRHGRAFCTPADRLPARPRGSRARRVRMPRPVIPLP